MLSFPLSAAAILIAMMQHCEEFWIDTSQIRSCGCDATNVNTARHNGSIALLEKNLGQELQRFMYCLHASQDRAAIQTHIHCIWWRDFWPQLVHRRYQKSSQDNRSVNEEFPSSRDIQTPKWRHREEAGSGTASPPPSCCCCYHLWVSFNWSFILTYWFYEST